MLASLNGHPAIVQILIDKGAYINKQMDDGTTALMQATQNGHTEVVRVLLTRGADPDLKDKQGRSAIDYASNFFIRNLLNSYMRK